MGQGKPHIEFAALNMDEGWEVPPGYPDSIQQKVLTSDLDEEKKTGSRTRFLRLNPGAFTTEAFVHDHWEEVYIVSGEMIVDGEPFAAPTYACRPPGAYHGPFKTDTGCLLYEFHYYVEPEGD